MSVITVEGLRKSYGGGVMAVDGVDVEVRRGEVVGLLGPSGCGKTTTLRCIAGLEEPTGGRITLAGQVVDQEQWHAPPEQRGVGVVFQSYALWPHMTVVRNVAFPLTYSSIPKKEHAGRAAAAMEAVGLTHLAERYPGELSGGQQQRVAVARAIVGEPAVLLFDEPLSNLDAKLRNQVRIELKALLRKLDATAVYVTHDQKEAMALCDRIAVMSDGVIRQIGVPEDIYEHPADSFVASFVGDTSLVPYRAVDGVVELAGAVVPPGSGPFRPGPGTAGEAVLRPENLALHPSRPAGTFGWPCVVAERLYLGTHNQYVVAVVGADTLLKVDAKGTPLAVGSSCFVAPDLDTVVWLDPAERRLESHERKREYDDTQSQLQ